MSPTALIPGFSSVSKGVVRLSGADVAVANQRLFRRVAHRQPAVDAANAVRQVEPAYPEKLPGPTNDDGICYHHP